VDGMRLVRLPFIEKMGQPTHVGYRGWAVFNVRAAMLKTAR